MGWGGCLVYSAVSCVPLERLASMQGADVTENKILFCHTDAGGIFCTTAGFRQEYIYVNEQKHFFSKKPISPVRIDFRVVKQLTYVDI